jgi:hypothetical protein
MTSIYKKVNAQLDLVEFVECIAEDYHAKKAAYHAATPAPKETHAPLSIEAQLKLELQRLFNAEKLKRSRFPILKEDERDTSGLPVEAPFDLNPYHLDDFSTPSGTYKDELDNVDHRKMEDLDTDPYRGGDWYANAVYATNALVGGGGKRKCNILMTRAFAESMSIGLSKDVSLDPRRLGTNPDPKDQVEGWYKVVLAPRGKPTIGTPREAWRLPLATWIQSLSRDEATAYLCNARIVYRHARMLKAHSLLKVLEYAGQELKARVLDTEETYC